jgi:hypothetical protein
MWKFVSDAWSCHSVIVLLSCNCTMPFKACIYHMMVISGAETAWAVPYEMAIVKAVQIYINQRYFMFYRAVLLCFHYGNLVKSYGNTLWLISHSLYRIVKIWHVLGLIV